MAGLRAIIGAMLLLPGLGCSMCCHPFDECGPLCNGECGCGCPSTARAGSYSTQTMYYEEATPTRAPRLAPTPAQPRTDAELPQPMPQPEEPTYMPETESPSDSGTEETPFSDPMTETPPSTEEEIPESIPETIPESDPIPETDTDSGIPDFDGDIPE